MEVFIEKLFDCEESKMLMDDWGLNLSRAPSKHRGYKLDAGNIVMGPKPIID